MGPQADTGARGAGAADPGTGMMGQGGAVAARRITLPMLATIVAVAAVLGLAADIFLPLALAMLLTFAISPLVARLRRRGWPQLPAVLTVVIAAFTVIGLFFLLVSWQLGQLARSMPVFQANIEIKLERLRETQDGTGAIARFSRILATVNEQIGSAVDPKLAEKATAPPRPPVPPLPVEVVNGKGPVETLTDLILPLVAPVATTGLVIVLVIFMLLERDEIRDRFIRLVGSNDLHRTTQVLEDAGGRVARYLQIQLLVNLIYAVPIGLGLWFIGVPNALLWGILTLVLRFVPYIGSFLAAAFPLFLAFAVSSDWTMVFWTAGLFLLVELITSNIIEPWLYGAGTGLSPLAIIVAAIFWTFTWGPLGLVLSTPLTVCLVVLGRHIPQFELFDILFGDEPALAPHARLYQRFLAGDAIEATFRAEEALETVSLAEYYRDVALPALMIGQADQARGVLSAAQADRLLHTATAMTEELEAVIAEEIAALREACGDAADADPGAETGPVIGNARLDGTGFRISCLGGQGALDDVAARMLAQTVAAEGAEVQARGHADLAPSRISGLGLAGRDCVILCYLDGAPSRAALLHVARLKRAAPALRVGVLLLATADRPVASEKRAEAEKIGADFVAEDLEAALAGAFTRAEARPVAPALRRRRLSRGQADAGPDPAAG